jgi:hypothetical protein
MSVQGHRLLVPALINRVNTKTHLRILFWIVVANYLSLIPYSLHLYHNLWGTNLKGTLLLIATFLLFLIPYILLQKGRQAGYIGMLVFLTVEFLFYLENFVGSLIHGFPPFYHLANPDPILFTAFLIGHTNFIAAGYYLYYFLKKRVAILEYQKI